MIPRMFCMIHRMRDTARFPGAVGINRRGDHVPLTCLFMPLAKAVALVISLHLLLTGYIHRSASAPP